MIVAVIPVKRLTEAKSRLGAQLTVEERSALVISLLEKAVRALNESGRVDRVALATAEIDLAERMGTELLPDYGSLNITLASAAQWTERIGASGILILPGDLPLIEARDIQCLVQAAPASRGVTVAPTHDGGTGALLLRPPTIITPAFGPDSFARHVNLARERDVPVDYVLRDAFRFDLDRPADLRLLAGGRQESIGEVRFG